MSDCTFHRLMEQIFLWAETTLPELLDETDSFIIRKKDRDVLHIELTHKNCLSEIIVSKPTWAPYRYVFFEASSFDSEGVELIYFFYDSDDVTENEIINELSCGVEYCSNYKAKDLHSSYLNKKGKIKIEGLNLNLVIHPSDLQFIEKDFLEYEFTCIGTQFQYLIIKNPFITLKVLPKIFK